MATLRYLGGDPLDPHSWRRGRKPLITSKPGGRGPQAGPYGPGHGSFINVGGETVAVFHAKDGDEGGWEGRKARVQRVTWTQDGPEMGGVTGPIVMNEQAFMAMPPPGAMPGSGNVTGSGNRQSQGRLEEQLRKQGRGLFSKFKEKMKNF